MARASALTRSAMGSVGFHSPEVPSLPEWSLLSLHLYLCLSISYLLLCCPSYLQCAWDWPETTSQCRQLCLHWSGNLSPSTSLISLLKVPFLSRSSRVQLLEAAVAPLLFHGLFPEGFQVLCIWVSPLSGLPFPLLSVPLTFFHYSCCYLDAPS